MNIPIEIMSPFAQIAQIYCPNVYKQLIDKNLSNHSSKFFFKNTYIFLICLLLTCLCTFIFIIIARFLSYIRTIRMVIYAIRRKFLHLS
jgi:hypothetical protein